jgi:hypothetical protein
MILRKKNVVLIRLVKKLLRTQLKIFISLLFFPVEEAQKRSLPQNSVIYFAALFFLRMK